MDAIYWLDSVRRTVRRLVFMLLILPWFQVGGRLGGVGGPFRRMRCQRLRTFVQGKVCRPAPASWALLRRRQAVLQRRACVTNALPQVIFRVAWCRQETDCSGASYLRVRRVPPLAHACCSCQRWPCAAGRLRGTCPLARADPG